MSDMNQSVELLRETNAGIQMGVSTLESIIDDVRSNDLKQIINDAKTEHDRLGGEAHKLLHQYGSDTKEPHPVAKAMSYVKTNVKMAAERTDRAAAELVTEGCSMGVESLNHYINKYKKADSSVVSLAKEVIRSEEELCRNVRSYL